MNVDELKKRVLGLADKLRTLEVSIKHEKDWLKSEALRTKYKQLDNECLSLMEEINIMEGE